MPTYDYRCEANGRVVEVNHRMSESLSTWGELCAAAGIAADDTAPDSPVKRLATGGNILSGGKSSAPEPTCSTGTCCAGGFCGLN